MKQLWTWTRLCNCYRIRSENQTKNAKHATKRQVGADILRIRGNEKLINLKLPSTLTTDLECCIPMTIVGQLRLHIVHVRVCACFLHRLQQFRRDFIPRVSLRKPRVCSQKFDLVLVLGSQMSLSTGPNWFKFAASELAILWNIDLQGGSCGKQCQVHTF